MPDVERSAEIVGPTPRRELVVDGYIVPGIHPIEENGGRVLFIVDDRFGYSVSAADFDEVAHLVADVYALGLGLSCHPQAGEVNEEDFRNDLRRVPILMRPRRMMQIVGIETEEAQPPDDPRNDG